MKQAQYLDEHDKLDALLHDSLQTECQPERALLNRVKHEMQSSARVRGSALLPLLPALCGTAMTGAMVFVLTLLFPDPPWSEIILALGLLCVLCAWMLTVAGIKLKLFNERRNALWLQ